MSVAAAQQAAGSSHGDPVYIPLSERRSEHTLTVPGRCLKDPQQPNPAKDPSNDGTTRAALLSEAMSDAATLEKKKALTCFVDAKRLSRRCYQNFKNVVFPRLLDDQVHVRAL